VSDQLPGIWTIPRTSHVWLMSGAVLKGQRAAVLRSGSMAGGNSDYLYHHVGQGILTITMHPKVIGRWASLLFLDTIASAKWPAPSRGDPFRRLAIYSAPLAQGTQTELPSRCRPAVQGMGSARAPTALLADVQRRRTTSGGRARGDAWYAGLPADSPASAMARALKLAGHRR